MKKKARRRAAPRSFDLPTSKTPGEIDLRSAIVLLYGREGIGKTTLAAQFNDPFLILTEPGAKKLDAYKESATSWAEIEGWVKAVLASDRFRTVVVDTADVAYEWCEGVVCRRLGIDDPGDEGYAKGWKACRKEFARVFQPLINSGRGVVFVSHETEKQLKRRGGKEETRILPSVGKSAQRVIVPPADLVIYYGADEDGRYLQLEPDDMTFAKNRWAEEFGGRSIIRAGSSPAEAYANFLAAFERAGAPTPRKATTKKTGGGMRAKARK